MSSKRPIKVFFYDNSFITLAVSDTATFESIWEAACQKIGLTVAGAECFFLWGVSPTLEVLLAADETLQEVEGKWKRLEAQWGSSAASDAAEAAAASNASAFGTVRNLVTLRSDFSAAGTNGTFKLLFRPAAVLPLSIERKLRDAHAVRLFYLQAQYNIVHSNYPTNATVAKELAGLQAQAELGNFNPSLHCQGFLSDADILRYIPYHLVKTRSPRDWEALIFAQHRTHSGKATAMAHMLYLQLCRQWKYYGSTFFAVVGPDSVYYVKDFEGPLRLGVNSYGLHIIDHKVQKSVSWAHNEIIGWELNHQEGEADGGTADAIYIDLLTDGKRVEKVFLSPQAELISDLLFDWVDELETQEEALRATRERQRAEAAAAAPPAASRKGTKVKGKK